eukprot:11971.XXX_418731_422924_1 [CDS] Oithona nana genome sequencing.
MTLAEKLEPPQILGPLSAKNQENYTVPLGGQTTLQCAVRSLGPTQIQWLKQLHDHQAPTDRNRTIVVFDFIFEILDPTTEMKDSGGIHNTTLDLGPPAHFVHAGRYICLVNNPEGHTHKEIFVRVLTDSQMQAFPTSGNGQPQSPASGASREETSSGNLVLEVNTGEQQMPLALMILIPILSFGMILVILTIVCIRRTSSASTASSSLTASPLVKTSVDASQNTSVDHHAASNTTLQTLKRLSSLHHFYAKPWAMVEVTNKANQTPSHWVYNDMTLEDNLINSGDLMFPFATSQSTFNTYITESQHNSPARFIQNSPYQHIYTNDKPPPPPYPPHLSTVMPIRTRSPHTPPFYALVKSDSHSPELYARPPSDHFYFKITDGKTEFI